MNELCVRTKKLALRCLKLADSLPSKPGARAMAGQLARSGTGVAANYRASQRARSRAEFCAKLQITLEESDETHFWVELIIEAEYLPGRTLKPLLAEANEITAILVAALKKARLVTGARQKDEVRREKA